jgi:hypothetical protein
MSAKTTFIRHYETAQGGKVAPPGLVKAASLFVLDLKKTGLSREEMRQRIQDVLRIAGGQTPETVRLDDDLMAHCVEQYDRPLPAPPPKPPDFVG